MFDGRCWFASALILGMLAGCANDQQATRAQGAGVGAAVGAGVGHLIGRDTESTVVGLAVGGAVGLALGDAVADRKARYASSEAMAVAETRATAQRRREMAGYNASLRNRIAEFDQDIAALEAAKVRGESDHGRSAQIREQTLASLGQAKRRLVALNDEIESSRDLYQQAAAAREDRRKLARWQDELGALERQRDELLYLIGTYETRTAAL